MSHFAGAEKKSLDDVKISTLRGNGSVVALKQYNNALKGKADYFSVNARESDGSGKTTSPTRLSEAEHSTDTDGAEADDENEENDPSKGKKTI